MRTVAENSGQPADLSPALGPTDRRRSRKERALNESTVRVRRMIFCPGSAFHVRPQCPGPPADASAFWLLQREDRNALWLIQLRQRAERKPEEKDHKPLPVALQWQPWPVRFVAAVDLRLREWSHALGERGGG